MRPISTWRGAAGIYRSVGDRCAVDFAALELPMDDRAALERLRRMGFRSLSIDVVRESRTLISRARYRRGARPAEAPRIVDCSSLVKWVYGQCGIWLPRRTIQQRECGHPIMPTEIRGGDLVFTTGWINRYWDDPSDGVGHVGIATDGGTIVHAMGRRFGVVETALRAFMAQGRYRGARRIIPRDRIVRTFHTPAYRCVETSDDVRWLLLQERWAGSADQGR